MSSDFETDINILYATYHKRVYNIALNLVQSIEDAEEVTQEIFVELHRSIHTFNQKSLLSTWIYRISVNKSLDFLKAKKRKKRFAFMTHLFDPQSGEQLHEAPSFTHPGVALEQKEQAKALYEAIHCLNEKQKTAFVLSQIEHVPQKEIAAIMDLSEKAIESLIQRAKGNLRIQLQNMYQKRRK